MLVVDRARKSFGSVDAVRGISFSIGPGVTFGLLGPNGAGKTTTMRMILGILAPDGGTISWNGGAVDERARRRFGYLPEERGLYGRVHVRDHIAYFGRLHGVGSAEVTRRTEEWIERLELQEYANRPCAELSKGNQQKVQVACAAVHRPDLLILDEPFSGLDPVNADILLDLLLALRMNGSSLVLSSHEMWQLERICTDFCIISAGTALASGTLAEFRGRWPTLAIRIAPGTSAVRAILAHSGANVAVEESDQLVAEVPRETDLAALLKTLVEAEAIVAFEPVEPSLRDVYLRVVGERQRP